MRLSAQKKTDLDGMHSDRVVLVDGGLRATGTDTDTDTCKTRSISTVVT
jgi:hypothetical protein